ncbi:MAG TPA: hypothetical protein VGE96_00860 [Steroidobacteraceae bacterium]
MAPLSYEQAAALIGVSTRRLRQIVRDGQGPEQTPDGRFPPGPFGKWLRDRHSREFGVATDGAARDLEAERARLTCAQANKAELEAAELRGELVRVDDVEETWTGMIAEARAKLLALPTKLAQRVAPPGKTAEAQAVAQEAVHEALRALAGDGSPRDRKGARARGVGAAADPDGEPMGRRASVSQPGVERRARKVVNGNG